MTNFQKIIQTVLEYEVAECIFPDILTDGTKIVDVVMTGDSGGNSMKHLFAVINNKEGKLKPHVFMIYEAADTLRNSARIYLDISDQIKAAEDAVYEVDGSRYKVRISGVYDMSVQDTILGK